MSDARSVIGRPPRRSPDVEPHKDADEGFLISPSLRRWLRRLSQTWTPSDGAALVVGLLSMVPVFYVVQGGALYADDIHVLALISTQPVAGTLFWSNGSHVVPGTLLVFSLQGRLVGYDYLPAMAVILVLRAAATYAVWRMLRLLFGPRATLVWVFALYAFTPLTLSATAWYIQAVTLLPVHLAVAGAVIALVRYHRTRLLRHALGVGAAMAGGLCFAEKTISIVVFLPVLACIFLGADRGFRVRLRIVTDLWPVWTILGVVAGGWAATFVSSGGSTGRPFAWSSVPDVLIDHLWLGLLPTLAAGPWTWRQGGTFYESAPFFGVAEPPLAASLLGALVLLAVLAIAVRRSRWQAVEALAILLAYYVPCAALVIMARLGELGNQLAIDLRFWADAAPALAVAIGMAIIGPPHRSVRTSPPRPLLTQRTHLRRTVAVVVAAVWLASLGVTTVQFARPWHANPSRSYLDALAGSMDRLEGTVSTYDTELPEDVLSPLFRPRTDVSFVAPVIGRELDFGHYTNDMLVVNDEGKLVLASWRTVTTSTDGPVGSCGWRLGPDNGARVQVPLQRQAPHEADQSVRLDFLAERPTSVAIDVWDGRHWLPVTRNAGIHVTERFDVPEGLVAIVLKTPVAAVEGVRARGRPDDGHICLLRAAIGIPTSKSDR